MKRPRTFRDQLNQNDHDQQGWANAMGVPVDEKYLNNLGSKRVIANHSDESILEAAVAGEVEHVLRSHLKVAFAVRQNSGEAEYETDVTRDARRVRYWRWVKKPCAEKAVIGDYWVMLKSGRFGCIEVKRRDWHMTPSDYRAQAQQAFINAVIAAGGFGGIVTSAEQARRILEGS